MKKFPIIAAAALSMGLITAPAIAHPQHDLKSVGLCDPVSEAKFQRIKAGMTITEVEYIVGCHANEFTNDGTNAYYIFSNRGKHVLGVYTKKGFVTTKVSGRTLNS